MRLTLRLLCLTLILAASTALADIAPIPDRGPPLGNVAGLDFMVRWVKVEMGPANGPHYTKSHQVVVLTGCTDGHPNCALAKSKDLIGMEVGLADGADLRPDKGMIQQIIDAFARKTGSETVVLEFYSRVAGREPVKIAFARR